MREPASALNAFVALMAEFSLAIISPLTFKVSVLRKPPNCKAPFTLTVVAFMMCLVAFTVAPSSMFNAMARIEPPMYASEPFLNVMLCFGVMMAFLLFLSYGLTEPIPPPLFVVLAYSLPATVISLSAMIEPPSLMMVVLAGISKAPLPLYSNVAPPST